jgi:hypothetical protein
MRIVGRTRSDYRNSSRLGLAREPLTHSSRSPVRRRRPSTSLARSTASRRQMIRMLTRQVIRLFGSKDGFGFCGRGVTRLQQAGSGAGNDESL